MFRKCIIRVSAWKRTILTEHRSVAQCVQANDQDGGGTLKWVIRS
jgi:hypothetical protein